MRTPLFLAAELDRSVSAKFLLEKGANATAKDISGNAVVTIMGNCQLLIGFFYLTVSVPNLFPKFSKKILR